MKFVTFQLDSSCSVPHFITNISCLFHIYNTNPLNKPRCPSKEYTFIAVIHSIYVKYFSLTLISTFWTPLFKGLFLMFLIVQNISFSLIAIDVCNPFSVAVNQFLYILSLSRRHFIIFRLLICIKLFFICNLCYRFSRLSVRFSLFLPFSYLLLILFLLLYASFFFHFILFCHWHMDIIMLIFHFPHPIDFKSIINHFLYISYTLLSYTSLSIAYIKIVLRMRHSPIFLCLIGNSTLLIYCFSFILGIVKFFFYQANSTNCSLFFFLL